MLSDYLRTDGLTNLGTDEHIGSLKQLRSFK